MNRAILIVICDFLVSAMLSMMTGMVPAHSGGTGVGLDETTTRMLLSELETKRSELEQLRAKLREATEKLGSNPEREAELRRLAVELASTMRRETELKKTLELTPETTGKLTPEELKKQLDREVERRLMAEIELKDKRDDLAEAKSESKELRSAVKTTGDAMNKLTEQYAGAQRRAAEADAKVAEAERQAARDRAELSVRDRELAAKNADLAGVREALKEMSDRVGQVARESQTLQTSLAVTGNRLNSAERDLAESRGHVEQLRRKLIAQELAGRDALRQRDDMRGIVKRAVAEQSRTRVELEKTKKTLDDQRRQSVENTVKLQVAKQRLADVEARLRNDVLGSYSAGAVRLDVTVSEDRLISLNRGGGRYYLPVVDFGGRAMVVGYFSMFAGDADRAMSFNNVTEVGYAVRRPDKVSEALALKGPLLAARRDPRFAAVPVDGKFVKPLRMISLAELKKRGLNELYLFKFGSFGKDSAELSGRCSLDFSGVSPYLFVRNNTRAAGGEVRAGVGDFVLTREGEFVGLVVGVDTTDYGKREEARVFIFSDAAAEWKSPVSIELGKQSGERHYDNYARQVKAVKTAIETQNF